MARRTRKSIWSNSIDRIVTAMTRTATRAGSKAIKRALRATPSVRKSTVAKTGETSTANWGLGVATSAAGARRYRLFKPPGTQRTERLPLMVMLHGCGQDAEAWRRARTESIGRLQAISCVCPGRETAANPQACGNWTERARGELDAKLIPSMLRLIRFACRSQSILTALCWQGSRRVPVAALLATRRPQRFRMIAMHSGIAPGVAYSSSTAFMAMRGRKVAALPLSVGIHLPALLVIHGSIDHIVAASTGAEAARLWAAQVGAKPSSPRIVQRGALRSNDHRLSH